MRLSFIGGSLCGGVLGLAAFPASAQGFRELTRTHAPTAVGDYACVSIVNLDATPMAEVVLAGRTSAQSLRRDARGTLARGTALPFNDGTVLTWLDVDGDGRRDVFVGREGGGHGLFARQGSGSFVDVTASRLGGLATGRITGALATDVDGNGRPDLVVTWSDQPAAILLNQGGYLNGTFGRLPLIRDARGVIAADIDGDGDRDLFVLPPVGLLEAPAPGLLLINDGAGFFVDETARRLGSSDISSAEFVDIDRDGDADLVTAGPPMAVWRNDGAGRFTVVPGAIVLPADGYTGLLPVDVDGDLDFDLITFGGSAGVAVLTNDGAGRFAMAAVPVPAGCCTHVREAAAGDLDGDGDLDLVFVRGTAPGLGSPYLGELSVHVWFNDGQGGFTDGVGAALHVARQSAAPAYAGDLDGDGYPDLVVPYQRSVQLLRNARGQGFVDATTRMTQPSRLVGIPIQGAGRLVDVDGDGDRDVILHALDGCAMWRNDAGTLRLARELDWRPIPIDLDGDGDLDLLGAGFVEVNLGNWMWSTIAVSASYPALGAHVGDIDGDGDHDIITADQGGLRVVINRSGVLVDETTARFRGASSAFVPTVADFDGDGDLDLVVDVANQVLLYVNDGTGVFAPRGPVLTVPARLKLAADLDGDGDTDLAIAPQSVSNGSFLCYNDGSGTFAAQPIAYAPECLLDVDRDRDSDVVGKANGTGATTLVSNLNRHLFVERAGFLGTDLDLRWWSRPDGSAVGDAVLPFLAAGLAATPLELPGLGTLFLPVGGMVALPPLSIPAPAGTLLQTLAIPSDVGLIGASIGVQGVVSAARNLRLTNAAVIDLVR